MLEYDILNKTLVLRSDFVEFDLHIILDTFRRHMLNLVCLFVLTGPANLLGNFVVMVNIFFFLILLFLPFPFSLMCSPEKREAEEDLIY